MLERKKPRGPLLISFLVLLVLLIENGPILANAARVAPKRLVFRQADSSLGHPGAEFFLEYSAGHLRGAGDASYWKRIDLTSCQTLGDHAAELWGDSEVSIRVSSREQRNSDQKNSPCPNPGLFHLPLDDKKGIALLDFSLGECNGILTSSSPSDLHLERSCFRSHVIAKRDDAESTTTTFEDTSTEEATTTESGSSTTEEVTTSSEEPATTTTEDITSTTDSATTTADVSTSTEDVTSTADPPTTTADPSTTTVVVSTTTDVVSTTTDVVSTTTEDDSVTSTSDLATSTTIIESATTTEDVTSTADPSTTTADSSTTIVDSSTTTVDPSTTTADPSTTIAESSTTTADLSTTTADASTTTADQTTTATATTTNDITSTSVETTSTNDPSTTTADPSTTTADPSTTTADPSTTTADPSTTATPSTTTADPSTTTAIPSTTTADPSTTTANPSTTTANPSTTTAIPSTTTATPSTSTAIPSTTTADPSTTTVGPSTTTADPSTTTADPSTTAATPSTTTATPSTTTAIPSTTTATPSTSTAIPSTTTADPSTTTVIPSTTTADPSTTTAHTSTTTTTTATPSTTTAIPSTTTAHTSTTTTESPPTTTESTTTAPPSTTTTEIPSTSATTTPTSTNVYVPPTVYDLSRSLVGNKVLTLPFNSIAAAGSFPIITITLTLAPSHGSLSPFDPENGITSLPVVDGVIVDANNAQHSILSYTPVEYFSGDDSFTLTVCDQIVCHNSLVEVTVTPGSTVTSHATNFTAPAEGGDSKVPLEIVLSDLRDFDISGVTLVVQPQWGTIHLSIKGQKLVAVYTPTKATLSDYFSFSICDFWGTCGTINVTVTWVEETVTPPTVCLGGIEIFALGGLLGIESFDFNSPSRFWFLADYMQFLASTSVYGTTLPAKYVNFVACFSWVNFDVSLSPAASETYPNSYPDVTSDVGHSRKRDYEQFVEANNSEISVVLLNKLFFFSVIFVPFLLLGTIFACVGVILRPSQFSDFQNSIEEDLSSRKRRQLILSMQWWCFGFCYRVAYFAYYSFTYGMAAHFVQTMSTLGDARTSLFQFSTSVAVFALVFGSVLFPVFSFLWAKKRMTRERHFLERTPFEEPEKRDFQKLSRLEIGRFMGPFLLYYRPKRIYFGLAVFLKKFLVAVMLGALQVDDQHALGSLATCLTVLTLYALSLVIFMPYKKTRYYAFDVILHLLQIVVVALLIATMLIETDVDLAPVIMAVHYAAMVFFLVLCLPLIALDLVKWRRKIKQDKKERYELGSRLASRSKSGR